LSEKLMSTHAHSSIVIAKPVHTVWEHVRHFDFPARAFHEIEWGKIQDGMSAVTVGAVRVVKWKAGQVRHHRLVELSDIHHSVVWELIFSDPPAESAAAISTIRLHRITETNETLISWSAEFSADIPRDLVNVEQKFYLENLKDIRTALTK